MKRTISLLLSFVIIVMFVGCNSNRHTQIDVPVYTMPDLEWWRENLDGSDANLSIGTSVHGGIATAEEIFSIMESIEFYDEISVKPIAGNDYLAHGISLTNWDEDKRINFTFYDDFAFVAIDENGTKVDQSPLYRYSDSEKVKQFFIDKGCYIAPHIRSEIVGRIDSLVNGGNQQLLNSLAQPATNNGETTFLPMMGKIKDVYVSNVFPVDNEEYYANVDLVYDCGTELKGFIGIFVLDKELELIKVYLTEDENIPFKINPYVIDDIDYSIWMEKLDSPYYNNFHYRLGVGNSDMSSSGMEWNTAIMSCIDNLELGKVVDINKKDYPRNQIYRIVLEEGSSYYNENTLFFEFYDDCNYLTICNHNEEGSHPMSVCDEHTKAYKVNNPQTVRDIFSMKGQYVSSQNYEKLQDFAQFCMENTLPDDLNNFAIGNKRIPGNRKFKGEIANFKAESTDHLSAEDGKEKYLIEFTAMFVETRVDDHEIYTAADIGMYVYKQGNGWIEESVYLK